MMGRIFVELKRKSFFCHYFVYALAAFILNIIKELLQAIEKIGYIDWTDGEIIDKFICEDFLKSDVDMKMKISMRTIMEMRILIFSRKLLKILRNYLSCVVLLCTERFDERKMVHQALEVF